MKRLIIGLIVCLVAIQIFRPTRTNPATDPAREIGASVPLAPEVQAIFSRACVDCHSNHTTWPWYSNVAPVSWLVTYDVKKGRADLNFSEWGNYSQEKRVKLLKKICREVSEGDMPGVSYSLVHPRAKLSGADVQALCRWSQNPALQVTEEKETTNSRAE